MLYAEQALSIETLDDFYAPVNPKSSTIEYKIVIPTLIRWEDGRKFAVDRVLDVRQAASLKVGGAGMRYTIRVRGKETFLFREQYRWFVEAI